MHCIIEGEDLYTALNSLQNITNKKGTLAILLNVLLETTTDGIVITGTDLEIGLRIFLSVDIKQEGKITIPSKKFFEIVRESKTETINLKKKEDNWIHIEIGCNIYNITGMPVNDFPTFPKYNDIFTEFESSIIKNLIEKTLYAAAGEKEHIYTLNSILFEKEERKEKKFLKMVSSDGHRLSLMEKEISIDVDNLKLQKTTLIPKKGLQELKKFCDEKNSIFISIQEKQLIAKDTKSTIIIRLKDGEFPNYQAIINTVNLSNSIHIERISLLESLRRINLFTDDTFHTIFIELKKNKIILTSQSAHFGNAKNEIDIKYNGEELKLGFNCHYFIETLQKINSNIVDIYINSDTSPCLIQSSEDPGFISIIMPMQIP